MFDDEVVRLQLHVVVAAEPAIVVGDVRGRVDSAPLLANRVLALHDVVDDYLDAPCDERQTESVHTLTRRARIDDGRTRPSGRSAVAEDGTLCAHRISRINYCTNRDRSVSSRQLTGASPVRQPRRNGDRVLRLLYLRHGGGPCVSGLFFPASDPATATLASLATFGIAFLARPIGSALFGHFGDRVGRKVTLVAALLTMGVSTVLIGALPTYETIGFAAPLLLALCRFGQGLGLGGEWGGAVLLAVENAPPGKRAWYGMFPQLGAPLGFLCSGGIFLLLSAWLTDEQFFNFGWRIPFLSSALLVIVGLYVRLTITETPVFRDAVKRDARVRLPMAVVFGKHGLTVLIGTFAALVTFVLFYLMTVFALSWGTTALGFNGRRFSRSSCSGFFSSRRPFRCPPSLPTATDGAGRSSG